MLAKYGVDQDRIKDISTVTVPVPDQAKGRSPTPTELRGLRAAAGGLNWLATRTRSGLARVASVLASGSTRSAEWRAGLWNNILRYLLETSDAAIWCHSGGMVSIFNAGLTPVIAVKEPAPSPAY